MSRDLVVFWWYFLVVAAAILLAGVAPEGALGLVTCGAGLAMVLARPARCPSLALTGLLVVVAASAWLAFLPQAWFSIAPWREALAANGATPMAASVTLSPDLTRFWAIALAGAAGVAIYLQGFSLREEGMARVALLVSLLTTVYAVLAITSAGTGWKPFFHSGAPFGFFPNRNHASTFLAAGAVVSLGLAYYDLRRNHFIRGVLAGIGCVAPVLGLMLYSESRSGVLLIVLGGMLWLAGLGRRVMNRKGAIVAVLLAGIGIAVFLTQESAVKNRLTDLARNVGQAAEGEDVALDFRVLIFQDAMRMSAAFPVTGVGLGNFAPYFFHYRTASAVEARALHPESDWLMLLTEAGWIPVLALLACVILWLLRVWKAREGDSWPVRWAFASAGLVGIFHGFVDVPWHRAPLGAWLLGLMAVALPMRDRDRRSGLALRMGFLVLGLALFWGGLGLVRGQWWGIASAPAFLEKKIDARLTELTQGGDFDGAEVVAKEAIQSLPMRHENSYWMGGILLYFADTDEEAARYFRAARILNPSWPRVTESEAMLWAPIDAKRSAEAWADSIRRGATIDRLTQRGPSTSAAGAMDRALRQGTPEAKGQLYAFLKDDPELVALWIAKADDASAQSALAELPDPMAFFLSLPAGQRDAALSRWSRLGGRETVKAFLLQEQAKSPPPGPYWRMLANIYTDEGNPEAAVRLVAEAKSVSLASRWKDPNADPKELSAFERELAALAKQRNDVAIQRLIREAVAGKKGSEGTSVAVAYFAESGDWVAARNALERLPTR